MKIILIGFKGVGKTTVGVRLAKRLQVRFIDTDDLFGEEVTKAYQRLGEVQFRQLEAERILSLNLVEPFVLATGGGSLENIAVLNRLKSEGVLVYLEASSQLLLKRYQSSRSQYFTDREELLACLSRRRRVYEQQASVRINTNAKSVEAIVSLIEQAMCPQ